MQDIEYLKTKGATPEKFRALFETKKQTDKIKELQELHSSRLRRAIETNLQEAPIYGAIDRCKAAAQNNLPFIQARHMAESGKTNEEIMQNFQSLGLEKMMEPVITVKPDGTEVPLLCNIKGKNVPMLAFNKPLFDTVFVPLVAAYCNMRSGKLFNDRNGYPRYKYAPPRMTTKDMVTADIITNRVQRMTGEMGYADDDKQSFSQMVSYGVCFNFPKEAYKIEQYDTKDGDKVVTKVQREGVRFVIPHPSRHFWDRSCPLYSFNSDTGVEYAGYWDIVKFSAIKDNAAFWNTDKITYGGYDLFTSATWSAFQMYYPCVISVPSAIRDKAGAEYDRIVKEQNSFLKDEKDATITHAVLFDKLIPKDWGLFDYDKPVWMRFVYANFGTCIFCEVLPYTPGYVYLDRYDANKTVADSIGLQLVPFEQLIGNFLTQHFISVKQNLMRIAFVNTDIVPEKQISMMKRLKDKLFQGIQFFTYSKKADKFLSEDKREAMTGLNMPQVDTQQVQANINLTLMVLERMLGFSAQEVGAAASHEQSAGEVNIIANNASSSLEYTGSGIDAAWISKKRLLYTAFYCYGTDEVFAEIADLTPERKKALEDLGFKVEEGSAEDTHAGVKGDKASLTLDTFISDREGVNRLNDSKVGIAMLQNLGTVAQNPVLFQSLGAKQFIALFNQVWKMVGLPEDFRLKLENPDAATAADPKVQQEQAMQAIEQAKQQIIVESVKLAEQQIGEQVKKGVVEPITQELMQAMEILKGLKATDAQFAQALEQLHQQVQVLQATDAKMMQGIEHVAAIVNPPQPPQMMPPQQVLVPPQPDPYNANPNLGPIPPNAAPI